MAYCSNCGSEMSGSFCGKCGAPASSGPSQPYSGFQSGAPAAGGLADNAAGALCYLFGFITGVIFLVIAPYNTKPGIRFHAFQSILLNVAWIVVWITLSIIFAMLPFGAGFGLSSLLWLLFLGLWLFMMFRAYQDQPFVLPVIGPLAQQMANKQ